VSPLELVCCSHICGCDTAVEAIPRLTEAGATALELFLGHPPHFDPRRPAEVAALRRALEASPLRVFSAHLSFGEGADFAVPGAAEREPAIARLCHELRVAAELGAQRAVVHPGEKWPDDLRGRGLAWAAKGLARLATVAEACGLDLAVENMPPGYLGFSAEELLGLVDGLGSLRAGICLDTGHPHLGGVSPADLARAFGDRILVLHWQDNDGTGDQHRFPGLGTINWPAFFAALKQIGFDGPVTAECGPLGVLSLAECTRLERLALKERRAVFV
jgi:sugar phosphate isomerase/epimerase